MNDKIGIKIKVLRNEMNITQEELANKLGLKGKSSIANYENGLNSPSDEIKIKMCEIFNCSIDYLMGKSDFKTKEDELNDFLEKQKVSKKNQKNKFYMCPVYGKIFAGQPNWAEECIDGRIPIDPILMDIINPEECYFLIVNGESMNKVIKNGAYALIRKVDWVENGEIAVVLVNGFDATLKKFTKQGELIILEPMSSDTSFKTQVYDKNTEIRVIGKYIGKFETK